jgi:hypothetical protein
MGSEGNVSGTRGAQCRGGSVPPDRQEGLSQVVGVGAVRPPGTGWPPLETRDKGDDRRDGPGRDESAGGARDTAAAVARGVDGIRRGVSAQRAIAARTPGMHRSGRSATGRGRRVGRVSTADGRGGMAAVATAGAAARGTVRPGRAAAATDGTLPRGGLGSGDLLGGRAANRRGNLGDSLGLRLGRDCGAEIGGRRDRRLANPGQRRGGQDGRDSASHIGILPHARRPVKTGGGGRRELREAGPDRGV